MKMQNVAGMGSLVAMVALAGCWGMPNFETQAQKAGDRQYRLLMDYVTKSQYGKPLPRVQLKDYDHPSFSTAQRNRIAKSIESNFSSGRKVVFEKWTAKRTSDIVTRVDALVSEALQDAATNGFAQCSAKFEKAREIAWQDCVGAKLDGKPVEEIDNEVRKAAIELLDTKVNPRHWPVIERELRLLADSFCADPDADIDKGILAVKNYALIRVYTRVLDARLNAVTAELVRLGIPESGLAPLAELARKAMSVAANIADLSDEVATEEKENRLDEGNNPDAARYRQLLQEYHDALILYNCTRENADKITKVLSTTVEGLIAKLRRDPKYGKEFLKHIKRLGASAINKRIGTLQAELVDLLEKNRAIREAALAPIRELQAKNNIREAQVLAVQALLKLDKNSDEAKVLRPLLINYITTKVNPELWAAIEKEILAKTEEFCAAGTASEGVKWLYQYPFIRTYAEEIDQRYADVKAEAIALGVPEAVADRYITEVMELTVPKEHLANFDDYTYDRVTPGMPLTDKQLAKYEKALKACRQALVDNDCTDDNADKLVEEIRKRFAPEFAKIGGETHEQVVVLGACALNKRLAELKDSCAARIIARCACNNTEAGKFAEARSLIRDIGLVGADGFDAKVFAVRVGTLNSIVNPLQLIAELEAIDKKAEEFVAAGDFRGLAEWAKSYPGVHDTYADIRDSVAAIRKAAIGIKVGEDDAAAYAEKLMFRLNSLMEKRVGEYAPPESQPDLTEVMKGVERLEAAVLAQYLDRGFMTRLRKAIPEEVVALLRKTRPESLTTWELNNRLRARLNEIVARYDMSEAIARQEYLELLAAMDGEYSYDSQIAMAEDAIAKQLGVKCPKSHLLANAVLGEYARAMRLLKLQNKLTGDQLAALVIGSVYLDQTTVFDRAKELGANVNAASPRDPLGRTALLFAIQLGRTAFVHRLVAAGAEVTVKDKHGSTAVHYAVRRGNLAVLNAMIAKNDVNVVNDDGQTALFDAARQNQAPLVDALVAAKADVAVVDNEGRTAFDFACECGSRDVLDSLAAAGSAYGPKQLAIAAAANHLGVAQWLVTHGTDVNGEGVMAAAKCGTDTKRYLVAEGGVATACTCAVCAPKPAVEATGEKTAEASGTLNFTIKETK